MKIVFDSGVLISFSETCFLSLFKNLKDNLGEFIITKNVKYEAIDRPKNVMRFKLSSIRIDEQLMGGVFTIAQGSKELDAATKKILDLTNNMFYVRGKPIKIIQIGEAESLALIGLTEASYLAVDERTTRMLIEEPYALLSIFKRKYNTGNINFDKNRYLKFKETIGNVQSVRSVDLFSYAYNNNLLTDVYKDKDALKAVLYALKFKGCAVSFEEINQYVSEM